MRLCVTIVQEDEDKASEIYFQLGKDHEGRIRYAMVTNKTYYILPVAGEFGGGQSITEVKMPADRKIHAKKLKTDSVDQTDGVPTEAYVWQVNHHDFKVAGGCCRPIQTLSSPKID